MSKMNVVERREDARLAALRRHGDITVAEKTEDGRIRIVRTNVGSGLLDRIDAVCEQMNKRAKRLGLEAPNGGEPVEVIVGAVEWKQRHPKLPAEPFHTVEIIGPSVPLIKPGYKLVGILESADKGLIKPDGNPRLIRRMDNGPDNDDRLNEYRDVSEGVPCKHCDKLRYRKRMIIVEAEAKNELQAIGSGCAKEYVELRESVIDFLATLFEIGSNGGERCSRAPWVYPLTRVVTAALYSYDQRGWVKKSRYHSNRESTADHVTYLLFPPLQDGIDYGSENTRWLAEADYLRWEEHYGELEEAATNGLLAEAKEVIEWVENSQPENDYQHNLKAAYTTEIGDKRVVTIKTINLAVSGVYGWRKAKEAEGRKKRWEAQLAKQKENAALAAARSQAQPQTQLPVQYSGHIGHVGGKLTDLKVKLQRVEDRDGNYGGYTLIEAIVVEGMFAGAKTTWFASNHPQIAGADVIKGQVVVYASAKIKKHTTYQGEYSTQLTRCKVVSAGPGSNPIPVPKPARPAPKSQVSESGKHFISMPQRLVVERAIDAGDWATIFEGDDPPSEGEIGEKERGPASSEWVGPIIDHYREYGWPARV